MNKIIEQINSWDFINQLPEQIEEFTLTKQTKIQETIIEIFRYTADKLKKNLIFYYNNKTKDYMLKRQFGFNEYNDINFINPSLEKMQNLLQTNLEATAKDFLLPLAQENSYILKNKGLYNWDYKNILPDKIDDFELYVKPDQPVKLINGAYIIIDYSNFKEQKQLLIYYNELTDSFYAESKNKAIVSTLSTFDSKQISDLEMLIEKKIKDNLNFF